MNKIIKIAVDAMGGDGSPKKVIDGIIHHFMNNKNSFYQIFGDKVKITPHIKSDLPSSSFEISVSVKKAPILRPLENLLEKSKLIPESSARNRPPFRAIITFERGSL